MGPNGLQVPGRARRSSASLTGVTAQRALFERARRGAGASSCSSTTGCSGTSRPVGLTPRLAERLRLLFRHDIALAAYHLPLDAHPEVGNNALLAEALGAGGHVRVRGDRPRRDVRRAGPRRRAVRARGRASPAASRSCSTPARPRSAGWRSSPAAAASRLDLAVAEGYDAFLTGEPKENVMADAREAGIHFIAAGHYATETFGVRRLGDWLADALRRRAHLGRHPESGRERECLARIEQKRLRASARLATFL